MQKKMMYFLLPRACSEATTPRLMSYHTVLYHLSKARHCSPVFNYIAFYPIDCPLR